MSSTRKVTIARRKPGQTGRKTTTRTSDSRRFAADKPAGRSPGLPRTTTSGSTSCLPVRRNSGATRRDRYIGAAYSCGYSSGMTPAARTGFPVISSPYRRIGGMEPDKRNTKERTQDKASEYPIANKKICKEAASGTGYFPVVKKYKGVVCFPRRILQGIRDGCGPGARFGQIRQGRRCGRMSAVMERSGHVGRVNRLAIRP